MPRGRGRQTPRGPCALFQPIAALDVHVVLINGVVLSVRGRTGVVLSVRGRTGVVLSVRGQTC